MRTVGAVRRDDTGEPLDFETFYRSEFDGLVRSMFLLVTDLDDAQELAQEAMVRVYERWDRVGAMESPGGYLYRVAVNLHRRRRRSLALRARRLVTLAAGQRSLQAIDPVRQELAEAIGSLSVRLREAFMLVDWLGMAPRRPGASSASRRRRSAAACTVLAGSCGLDSTWRSRPMDDLVERVHRDLDGLRIGPAPFDDVARRVAGRARRRRVGAGVLGVALTAVVIAGAWVVADREGDVTTAPVSPGPVDVDDRLFLAGDGEAWIVDPSTETAQHLPDEELPPGDAPFRVVRRADSLVAWGYRTLVAHPGSGPTFDVLVRDSLFFIPSSAPDRVWVGIVDEAQDDGRLTAVREVAIDGSVTVPDTAPPDGAWPVAAVDGNLVFQRSGELVVWDPATGRDVDRLPGELPVAWQGSLLAWCDGHCRSVAVKDLRSGAAITVQPPAGATGFEALYGAFSPDGRTLAVAVRLGDGEEAERQLALIDVDTGRLTLVDGASIQTPYVFIDWAPSGDTVFITGGQLAGHRRVVEYRIGDATARVLHVVVGDFFGMAAFQV